MSWRVNIREMNPAPGRPADTVVVDCDSVVALLGTQDQAAFCIRSVDAPRLAVSAATLLVRLHNIDPAIMATAIELIRRGRVAPVLVARDPRSGENVDIDRRPRAEVINVIRLALDMELRT